MAWLGRKIDSLIGALFAALGGMACSQLNAFVHQYVQRLGGHLDEAQRNLAAVAGGERYPNLDSASRQAVIDAAQARVVDIETAYQAIKGADALARPFVFIARLETDIAVRVFADFQPALPLDPASLAYAAAGMAVGLALYEILKIPFAIAAPKRN